MATESSLPSGVVYLLHAERGLHVTGNRFAQHYIGYSSDYRSLWFRLDYHRAGSGAKLVAAWNEAEIGWTLARVWEHGTRTFERELKNRRNHPRLCPVCAAERRTGGYDVVWPPGHSPRATRRELDQVRAGLRWHRTREAQVRWLASLLLD